MADVLAGRLWSCWTTDRGPFLWTNDQGPFLHPGQLDRTDQVVLNMVTRAGRIMRDTLSGQCIHAGHTGQGQPVSSQKVNQGQESC